MSALLILLIFPQSDLGAETRSPTAAEAKDLGLGGGVRPQGQIVTAVAPDGPAAKAGIKEGDVILKLNENTFHSVDSLRDFLAVTPPGAKVKATLKRGEVEIELGKAEAERPGIRWEHAGLEQLDAALKRAKKEKKPVLVGLSGAETWWPTTRFESRELSKVIADKAVVEESAGFIRVIIRRPQAYSFRGKYKAPIPGIALIDSEGKRVETFAFRGEEQAKRLAETLRKLKDWAVRNGTLDSALEPLLDRLYYTALDMTGNAADAEDVTQDAVLKAIRAHRTFVPGTDFRAWVFRILTNTVIDFYRRRRPPFAFAEPEAPRPAESESVEAALRSLEPEQKMAVILVDLHDFSMKEAAEMMGCPVGTVGSRLFRGREALRRRLAR